MVKMFLASMVSFIILDFLWLGFVVKKFNLKQLAEIGRIVDGDFQIMYGSAGITYILMAAAVTFYVMPMVQGVSMGKAFLWGAFLGLIIYGVFDTTNMAILKNYPIAFALADMAWGTFVFGAVTVLTKYVS